MSGGAQPMAKTEALASAVVSALTCTRAMPNTRSHAHDVRWRMDAIVLHFCFAN